MADFNNDKKPDLAFGGSAFLGTGDGGFVAVNLFTNSDTRHGWILGGGDFTGDGNADLVCVQPESQIDPQAGDVLSVWAGDGNGGVTAPTNSYKVGFARTTCSVEPVETSTAMAGLIYRAPSNHATHYRENRY